MAVACRCASRSRPVRRTTPRRRKVCYPPSARVRCCWQTRLTTPTGYGRRCTPPEPGPISPPGRTAKTRSVSARPCTASATSSSASSISSNIFAASQHATTNSAQPTLPWSNWPPSASDCAFMSRRPSVDVGSLSETAALRALLSETQDMHLLTEVLVVLNIVIESVKGYEFPNKILKNHINLEC